MIYLILFLVFFFFSIIYDYYGLKKNRTLVYWFLVFLLIFFAGFRYHIGLDSIRISSWYEDCPNIYDLDINYIDYYSRSFQPLWIILCSVLKTISPNFALLQFVQSALVNILIFKFVKKKTSNIFSFVLIYYLLAYVYFNFEIMRESIAISISLYAVLYYEQKKWFKSILLLIIAFEFHVSSLIMLIYPIFVGMKHKKYHIFIGLAIVVFISSTYTKYIDLISLALSQNDNTIFNYILTYSDAGEIGSSIMYYINVFFIGFFFPAIFLYLRNSKTNFNTNFKYSSIIILYTVFSLLGNQSVAFLRFSNYQLIFYLLLIAEVYNFVLIKYKSPGLIGFIFCITISFSFIYSMFKPAPEISGTMTYSRYYPYYTIITEKEDNLREHWSDIEFY